MKLRSDVEQFLKDNIIRESVPPRSVPVNKLTPNSTDGILRTNDGLTSWLSKGSAGQSIWVNPSTLELEFFTPPNARVYAKKTVAGTFQAIAQNTWEWVDWTDTDHNSGCTIDISGGDNSTSNYIQVPYSGLYLITARLTYQAAGVAVRIGLRIDNQTQSVTHDQDMRYVDGTDTMGLNCNTIVRLNASDKIACSTWWTFGGAGAISTYADSTLGDGKRLNHLEVAWLAP